MATTASKRDFSRLQEDINGILDGIEHLFDDIAEYSQETDPQNVIDLDKVLTMETPKKPSPAALHAKHRNAFLNHISTHKARVESRKFPHNPARVVRAMPQELQKEVRIYESHLEPSTKQKIAQLIFKRLEF